MTIDRSVLDQVLSALVDPNTGRTFQKSKTLRNIRIEQGHVSIDLVLGYAALSQFRELQRLVDEAVRAVNGVDSVLVAVSQEIVSRDVQRGLTLIENVKNIIAVSSAKGGVGKSTTTANLALALKAEGATVGILDADIYGPSLPLMLGLHGKPESPDGKRMDPLLGHGLQANSIGFFLDDESPVIWRGPMVTSALENLLRQTNWRSLDYLLVDMPPGTGDIHLTLAQKVPLTGAVIVTTPQDLALADARRGLKMFEKVGVPVLGILENMSVHLCSQCGHAEHIFGEGGAQKMCAQYEVNYLGALPLDIAIRQNIDSGTPSVAVDPDGHIADLYRAVARKVGAQVANLAKETASKFPRIVVSAT